MKMNGMHIAIICICSVWSSVIIFNMSFVSNDKKNLILNYVLLALSFLAPFFGYHVYDLWCDIFCLSLSVSAPVHYAMFRFRDNGLGKIRNAIDKEERWMNPF